jgi:ureidoglycolate lyase
MRTLTVKPLTAAEFAPFGELIAAESAAARYAINEGSSIRFHDLARIDTDSAGGRPVLSLFRAQPRALPFAVRMLERHPLGSQAFIPLDPGSRYLVVVAADDLIPQAFLASHSQGINLHSGVWHHPLLALDRVSDFLVIDRGGPGENCEERRLQAGWMIASLDN